MRTLARELRRRHPNTAEILQACRSGNIDDFVHALNAGRDRRIDLIPVPAVPGSPCGLAVSTDQADYIFYAANTTPFHQLHIQCHELVHVLLGHTDTGAKGTVPVSGDPLIERLLGGPGYSSEQERDAELVGSLIVRQIVHGRQADDAPGPTLTVLAEVFDRQPAHG